MAKNLILKISEKGAKKTATALKSVGSAVKDVGIKAGVATAGIGVLSAKLSGDFQKSLLEVSTLTGDFSDVALKKMSRELRQVASSSGLALDSISKAKYDIVSAGFSNAAESAEILSVSTELAVGGVTSAAEAADLLTTSINALGLNFDDARGVADDLFTTVQLGKTTIGELSASFGQVLPFAKAIGLDLAGVGSAMATLTASGISTAQASTSLRSALQALQSPTESSKNLMRDLGIEIKRFEDGSVDLTNTIKQFQGLDPDTMRRLVPSIEASLAVQTLSQNFDKLSENVETFATRTSSSSQEAFKQMSRGFNQQMSMLRNSIHSIFIEIGNVIIEVIQPTLESVNTEFARLGEIGFDNLAKAVKDQLPEILDVLQQAFFIAIKNIESRFQLLGDRFLDAINPFKDLTDNINKRQKLLETQLSLSTDIIKDLFSNMYLSITSNAEMSARKQDEIASFLEASEIAKYKAEIDRLTELIENRQGLLDGQEEVERERQERTTEREKELLTVRGLAQQQYFDKVSEQVKQLIQLGVDATQAEQHGAKLRMQFISKELSAKTNQTSSFLSLAKQASGVNKNNAKLTKALAKGEATVKAFEAANKTFAKFGGFPTGIVPAGLALAIGMGNVASIDAQSFAGGGIVQGIDTGQGDTVPTMLTPGELILNQAQQENLASGMGSVVINIQGDFLGSAEQADKIANVIEDRARLGFNRISTNA